MPRHLAHRLAHHLAHRLAHRHASGQRPAASGQRPAASGHHRPPGVEIFVGTTASTALTDLPLPPPPHSFSTMVVRRVTDRIADDFVFRGYGLCGYKGLFRRGSSIVARMPVSKAANTNRAPPPFFSVHQSLTFYTCTIYN